MNIVILALEGALSVLLAGLLLGAGLPAIFALGIRALALGGTPDENHRPTPLGKALAGLCFGVVLLGVLAGLGVIIAHGFGATLSFDGLVPTFEAK